jgi:hypothetical protein
MGYSSGWWIGLGFQVVVIIIDSFMDEVTYVRDVEVCMYSMICYIKIKSL